MDRLRSAAEVGLHTVLLRLLPILFTGSVALAPDLRTNEKLQEYSIYITEPTMQRLS